MRVEAVRQLNWQSPELSLVKPNDFPTFYPPKIEDPVLEAAIKKIGGNTIERAHAYGSYASGDATKTSLMDLLLIVRNPWLFYEQAKASGCVKLGTMDSARFHALWSYEKGNYHLATLELNGNKQGAKIAVLPHNEVLKHAKGGSRDPEGKGKLYQAGRLHKVALPMILDDTTPEEGIELDQAINRARIDGMWLALGLVSQYFTFDELAGTMIGISYKADRRVEKAGKAEILFAKSYDDYKQMFNPMLQRFEEAGVIRSVTGVPGVYQKLMSFPEELVNQLLKESASHAFRVNFFQNTWTMGPLNGAKYGLAKVRRAKGW